MNYTLNIRRTDLITLFVTMLLRPDDSSYVTRFLEAAEGILRNGFMGFGHMTNPQLIQAWENWISAGEAEDDMEIISEYLDMAGLPQITEAFWKDPQSFDKDGNCRYTKVEWNIQL